MEWSRVSDPPPLDPHEVQVLRASLGQPATRVAALRDLLSDDERARADRFVQARHGARFTVARGLLRVVIGALTGTSPQAVAFAYGPHGKPALRAGGDLRFNISHSGSCCLLAVARGCDLGVDLERVKPDREHRSIARRFFSEEECASLLSRPEERMVEAFYRIWTRKEAYIKAIGRGLSMPLDRFAVSPDDLPKLLLNRDDPAEVTRWTFHHLNPGPGYAGALAIEDASRRLRLLDWDDDAFTRATT